MHWAAEWAPALRMRSIQEDTPITHKDPTLLLLNGELIASWHLDGLVEEANVALQDAGKVQAYANRERERTTQGGWCTRPLPS